MAGVAAGGGDHGSRLWLRNLLLFVFCVLWPGPPFFRRCVLLFGGLERLCWLASKVGNTILLLRFTLLECSRHTFLLTDFFPLDFFGLEPCWSFFRDLEFVVQKHGASDCSQPVLPKSLNLCFVVLPGVGGLEQLFGQTNILLLDFCLLWFPQVTPAV